MIFYRLAVAILLVLPTSIHATTQEIRIGPNNGGLISDYRQWAAAIADTGKMVVVTSRCISACTLFTEFVPRERICVLPGAYLGFHRSSNGLLNRDTGEIQLKGPSLWGTRQLWSSYPPYLRTWLKKNGGLTAKLLVLKGRELTQMFHACPEKS